MPDTQIQRASIFSASREGFMFLKNKKNKKRLKAEWEVGINKRGEGGLNSLDSYFPQKGNHSLIRIPPHDPNLPLCPNFQTPVFTIEQFKFKHRNWEGGHPTAGQSDKGRPLPLEVNQSCPGCPV